MCLMITDLCDFRCPVAQDESKGIVTMSQKIPNPHLVVSRRHDVTEAGNKLRCIRDACPETSLFKHVYDTKFGSDGFGTAAPAAPRMSGRGGIWHAKRRWGEVPMAAFYQQQKPWRFCGYCGRPRSAMWLFCVGCRAKLHELPPPPRLDAYDREVSESEGEDDDDDAGSGRSMGPRTISSTCSAGAPTAGTASAPPPPTSAQRGRTRSPALRAGKGSKPRSRFN